jgi:hypothetical protein
VVDLSRHAEVGDRRRVVVAAPAEEVVVLAGDDVDDGRLELEVGVADAQRPEDDAVVPPRVRRDQTVEVELDLP